SRGEDVFSGYLYIVEDDWAIHSLELSVYKFGFRFDIKQAYAPIREQVWMPVATQVDIEGKIIGIALEGHYVSTVSNYDITLNPDLPGYVEVIDEKTAPEEAKAAKRENKARGYEQRLAEGGELTRKELRQLMREYERKERREADKPEVQSDYTFIQDSAASVNDTAYWASIRPVPLTKLEKRSYAYQDSLATLEMERVVSMTANNDSITTRGVAVRAGSDGTRVRTFGRRRRLVRFYPNSDIFNPVEGYAAGVRIAHQRNRKGREFNLGITPRYGFSWGRLTFKGDLSFERNTRQNYFSIRAEGGRFLRQFDDTPAMPALLNTITTLFAHENYVSWYEREYGSLAYEQKWDADFELRGQVAYEERRRVFNTSEQGWFNLNREDEREFYRANNPLALEIADTISLAPLLSSATIKIGGLWRPGQRYEIEDGNRSPVDNTSPTLGFEYFGGFAGIGNSESDFHRLEASYQHRFQLGIRGRVDVLIRAGAYLNNNTVQLPDFKHFATTEIFYTNADPISNYRLLPYYAYSTQEEYIEFFGHYQFRKFLLSRIWNSKSCQLVTNSSLATRNILSMV
ncbi:MAG: DUF5686 family protein, partial [Bacteroidota bacterium]